MRHSNSADRLKRLHRNHPLKKTLAHFLLIKAEDLEDTGNTITFMVLFTLVKTWFFATPVQVKFQSCLVQDTADDLTDGCIMIYHVINDIISSSIHSIRLS